MLGSQRLAGDLAWRLGHDLWKTKQISLWVICLSLALAGLTFFWARRAGFPVRRHWHGWRLYFSSMCGFITFRLAAELVPACSVPAMQTRATDPRRYVPALRKRMAGA